MAVNYGRSYKLLQWPVYLFDDCMQVPATTYLYRDYIIHIHLARQNTGIYFITYWAN